VSEESRKLEINWVQAAAGALAAMSSAVLLSTVGVAGTLVGAAVGSVVVTLGNAVYSHYLQLSRERVSAAHAAARLRVERARADVQGTAAEAGSRTGVGAGLDAAERELGAAERDLTAREGSTAHVGLRESLSGLPWKRLAWIAAAIFVVAMLVILAFELITGRAVSTYTGGSDGRPRTSIGLGGDDKPEGPTPSPSQRPSATATATATTEETPTAEPTSAPPSPTVSETAATPVPQETASELPTSSAPPPSETVEPTTPEPSP
jgi:hypothetical protein